MTSSRGWISRRYRTPTEHKFWERRRKNSKSILLSQSALRTSKHNKQWPFCDQNNFWPKNGIVLGHFYQKMAKNGTKIHFSQKELDRIFLPFWNIKLECIADILAHRILIVTNFDKCWSWSAKKIAVTRCQSWFGHKIHRLSYYDGQKKWMGYLPVTYLLRAIDEVFPFKKRQA